MSAEAEKSGRLELLLARLLDYGSWLASAVIGLGLAWALIHWRSGAQNAESLDGMRIVTAGVALFILLPIFRVIVMLIVFVRERDYRYIAITAFVLLIILAGFVAGMAMKSPPPA